MELIIPKESYTLEVVDFSLWKSIRLNLLSTHSYHLYLPHVVPFSSAIVTRESTYKLLPGLEIETDRISYKRSISTTYLPQ